jgi:hypothetical protein
MVKGNSSLRNKRVHSSKPYDVSNVSKRVCSRDFARNAVHRSGSKIERPLAEYLNRLKIKLTNTCGT